MLFFQLSIEFSLLPCFEFPGGFNYYFCSLASYRILFLFHSCKVTWDDWESLYSQRWSLSSSWSPSLIQVALWLLGCVGLYLLSGCRNSSGIWDSLVVPFEEWKTNSWLGPSTRALPLGCLLGNLTKYPYTSLLGQRSFPLCLQATDLATCGSESRARRSRGWKKSSAFKKPEFTQHSCLGTMPPHSTRPRIPHPETLGVSPSCERALRLLPGWWGQALRDMRWGRQLVCFLNSSQSILLLVFTRTILTSRV